MLPRTALAVIAAQSHLLAERTLADGVAAAGAARGAVAEAMPPLELSSWPDASRRRHPVPLLVDCRVTSSVSLPQHCSSRALVCSTVGGGRIEAPPHFAAAGRTVVSTAACLC